ncbi:hypothetical protein [Micromonospora craniellae]|uniref:DUF3558 domain-containing protein n=1 Tax=Micromonospora craniellae TaxID=2294034 RepID=A0A372G2K8_9ACTN|nr:hypothetical protein [Micromonospora craniellae]QOC92807.1 hypothetical protein ID554_03385 [Micromonospora craniellae]RFS46950.1 hypothetical protein D0Q02_09280 [Micromonospora craniellae]
MDACALVTQEEAEKLAGTPLEEPVSVRETCTYTGPVSGPLAQVEVFVSVSGTWVAVRLVRLDDPAGYAKRLTDVARTVAGRL